MKAFRSLTNGAAVAVAGCRPWRLRSDRSGTKLNDVHFNDQHHYQQPVQGCSRILESAIESYAIVEGGGMYPETLEPVAAMYLRPDFSLSEWSYAGLGTTYTLTGSC